MRKKHHKTLHLTGDGEAIKSNSTCESSTGYILLDVP